MIYLIAILTGLLGAGIGAVAGFLLGSVLASSLGISSFEGAAGYFAVAIGILVGFIGLVTGIVLALRYKGGTRGFLATAGRTSIVLIAIAALVTVGTLIRLATLENFSDGNPTLEFEIRLPAGMPAPDRKGVDFEMQAGSQRSGGIFSGGGIRSEGNRVVLCGIVPLYTRTSQRILVVTLPGQPKRLFQIGLASTPKTSEDYSAWQKVSHLDDMKQDGQPRRPNAAEDFEIRTKVPDWKRP